MTRKIRDIKMDEAIEFFYKHDIDFVVDDANTIRINHHGCTVIYYPKSEWFTGKSVVDGRGIYNLLRQLKQKAKISKQ